MSVQTSTQGETVTVIHKYMAYHFRRAYNNTLKLKVIDELKTDESIPGAIAPRIPAAVTHELREQGYTVVR